MNIPASLERIYVEQQTPSIFDLEAASFVRVAALQTSHNFGEWQALDEPHGSEGVQIEFRRTLGYGFQELIVRFSQDAGCVVREISVPLFTEGTLGTISDYRRITFRDSEGNDIVVSSRAFFASPKASVPAISAGVDVAEVIQPDNSYQENGRGYQHYNGLGGYVFVYREGDTIKAEELPTSHSRAVFRLATDTEASLFTALATSSALGAKDVSLEQLFYGS